MTLGTAEQIPPLFTAVRFQQTHACISLPLPSKEKVQDRALGFRARRTPATDVRASKKSLPVRLPDRRLKSRRDSLRMDPFSSSLLVSSELECLLVKRQRSLPLPPPPTFTPAPPHTGFEPDQRNSSAALGSRRGRRGYLHR